MAMTFESPEKFFRQILIVYEFIFYRLDRPFLPPRVWPEFLKILKEALKKSSGAKRNSGPSRCDKLKKLIIKPVPFWNRFYY
jgi:hypothetical protein